MKRIYLFWFFAAAFLIAILSVIFLAGAWLQAVLLILMAVFFYTVLVSLNKAVLKRSLPGRPLQNVLLMGAQSLLFALSAVLAALDIGRLGVSQLPGWCLLLGLVLLVCAYILMVQSLLATPRHVALEYGQTGSEENKVLGPYEVLRHPCMAAMMMAYVGLPLFLGSALGFIPAALGLVVTVWRVIWLDDYRFAHYNWYYDYTQQVSYRILPFIW